MGRKHDPQEKKQKSKRARLFEKQAVFAFGLKGKYLGHPSHESYRPNRRIPNVRKNWDGLL